MFRCLRNQVRTKRSVRKHKPLGLQKLFVLLRHKGSGGRRALNHGPASSLLKGDSRSSVGEPKHGHRLPMRHHGCVRVTG